MFAFKLINNNKQDTHPKSCIAFREIEGGLNDAYGTFITFMNDIKEKLRLLRGFAGKPYFALEYISDEIYVVPD